MKKLSIFLTLVMIWTLVSCNQYKVDSGETIIGVGENNELTIDTTNCDKNFDVYINPSLIGEEQVNGNANKVECFTKYLGELSIVNDKHKYYVISQFYTVQSAISKHGHSRIIILDSNKNVAKIYNLDMPHQLPKKIEANNLIFKFDDEEYKLQFEDEFPKLICLPNNKGCY